jgi:hypothetical protein
MLSLVCVSIFSFICMFCRSLFVLLAIVLSVLRFTDSNYPFGILQLFLTHIQLLHCRPRVKSLLLLLLNNAIIGTISLVQILSADIHLILILTLSNN